MPEGSDAAWAHASLSLVQPGWPGTKPAQWVARAAGVDEFRSDDLLEAMDRLGAAGWELVTFSPEWGDRAATYHFKRRRQLG